MSGDQQQTRTNEFVELSEVRKGTQTMGVAAPVPQAMIQAQQAASNAASSAQAQSAGAAPTATAPNVQTPSNGAPVNFED